MIAPKTVTVTLGVEEALDLIAANFERSKTAVARINDGGWKLERSDRRLTVSTNKPLDYLLEPLPDDFLAVFPETLAVQIEAAPIEDFTRVRVRLIRCRLGAAAALAGSDVVGLPGGLPFAYIVIHTGDMAMLRSNRRAAKARLVRLALEPLIPYERSAARGPFRG